MLEFGQILGLFAAVVLGIAIAAWAKLAWSHAPHPIQSRSGAGSSIAEFASQIMVLAFALSAVAVIFAVVGLIGL